MIVKALTFAPCDGVPAPVAPYSHITTVGPWSFVTGQIPIDPMTGEICSKDVQEQTNQVMANLVSVLSQVGSSLNDVVMVRAFLVNMDDYEAFNATYALWFSGNLPSRTCVGVTGLARGVLVEIDLTAYTESRHE